jgi:hypothetical protein
MVVGYLELESLHLCIPMLGFHQAHSFSPPLSLLSLILISGSFFGFHHKPTRKSNKLQLQFMSVINYKLDIFSKHSRQDSMGLY